MGKETTSVTEKETALVMKESTSSSAGTWHFYFDNWKQRGIRVMDSDKSTPLYHADIHLRKPNLVIQRASPDQSEGQTVATVAYHTFHTNIETEINGRPIKLRCKGKSQASYEYPAPAFNDQMITWEGHSLWPLGDVVCLDENKNAIARMVPKCTFQKTAGRIEFAEEYGSLSREALDEIVVASLSIFYYKYLTSVAVASS